jgi:predicted enzyme related to lactoylglutathione lyase
MPDVRRQPRRQRRLLCRSARQAGGRSLSPTFAMFALESGVMLGLWSRHTVKPAATPPGGGEIAFTVADIAALNAVHGDWRKRGLTVIQPPTRLDFGDTFVALDPDGHRLRVFAPAAP